MTKSLENYLELHRHAVVRKVLLGHPGLALRLMVAHAMASSGHWRVGPERQQARNEAVAKSVAASPAQQAFNAERKALLASFKRPDDEDGVVAVTGDDYRTASVLARLLVMSDEEVMRVAAFVMAETLAAGSVIVEALGSYLHIDARQHWQPDDAFFDLIRDRATVNAMLAEVAGKTVADANVTEKGRAQKQIIRDALAGANGRVKVEGWLPGVMAFPFRAYGEGSCGIADAAARVAGLLPKA